MSIAERRTGPARRGMTVLGKIPAVPKPINLPSQRLEHRGLDPNVEIVPRGTLSWGSAGRSPPTGGSAWGNAGHSSSPSVNASGPWSGAAKAQTGSVSGNEPRGLAESPTRPSSAGSGTRPSSAPVSSGGAWGVAAAKSEEQLQPSRFNLTPVDFPTLGSEKNPDLRPQQNSTSSGRPASADGNVLDKERWRSSVPGPYQNFAVQQYTTASSRPTSADGTLERRPLTVYPSGVYVRPNLAPGGHVHPEEGYSNYPPLMRQPVPPRGSHVPPMAPVIYPGPLHHGGYYSPPAAPPRFRNMEDREMMMLGMVGNPGMYGSYPPHPPPHPGPPEHFGRPAIYASYNTHAGPPEQFVRPSHSALGAGPRPPGINATFTDDRTEFLGYDRDGYRGAGQDFGKHRGGWVTENSRDGVHFDILRNTNHGSFHSSFPTTVEKHPEKGEQDKFQLFDPCDYEGQRGKPRETADQRAKQRQRDEEDRLKEQKPKTLAKFDATENSHVDILRNSNHGNFHSSFPTKVENKAEKGEQDNLQPGDHEGQRAKPREPADQRARQRQRDDEGRIKDQKAKAGPKVDVTEKAKDGVHFDILRKANHGSLHSSFPTKLENKSEKVEQENLQLFDACDNEGQNSSLRETADQRANKQRQREEEERMKEQKAKAVIKHDVSGNPKEGVHFDILRKGSHGGSFPTKVETKPEMGEQDNLKLLDTCANEGQPAKLRENADQRAKQKQREEEEKMEQKARPLAKLEVAENTSGVHSDTPRNTKHGSFHPTKVENNPEKGEQDNLQLVDSYDYEGQRAKLRETAAQRAKQRQREEEERIKEQKAKALAKLEELNRRTREKVDVEAVPKTESGDGSAVKVATASPIPEALTGAFSAEGVTESLASLAENKSLQVSIHDVMFQDLGKDISFGSFNEDDYADLGLTTYSDDGLSKKNQRKSHALKRPSRDRPVQDSRAMDKQNANEGMVWAPVRTLPTPAATGSESGAGSIISIDTKSGMQNKSGEGTKSGRSHASWRQKPSSENSSKEDSHKESAEKGASQVSVVRVEKKELPDSPHMSVASGNNHHKGRNGAGQSIKSVSRLPSRHQNHPPEVDRGQPTATGEVVSVPQQQGRASQTNRHEKEQQSRMQTIRHEKQLEKEQQPRPSQMNRQGLEEQLEKEPHARPSQMNRQGLEREHLKESRTVSELPSKHRNHLPEVERGQLSATGEEVSVPQQQRRASQMIRQEKEQQPRVQTIRQEKEQQPRVQTIRQEEQQPGVQTIRQEKELEKEQEARPSQVNRQVLEEHLKEIGGLPSSQQRKHGASRFHASWRQKNSSENISKEASHKDSDRGGSQVVPALQAGKNELPEAPHSSIASTGPQLNNFHKGRNGVGQSNRITPGLPPKPGNHTYEVEADQPPITGQVVSVSQQQGRARGGKKGGVKVGGEEVINVFRRPKWPMRPKNST